MNGKTGISIVLPVYNQADHIESIVEAYLATFENFNQPVEWLLVENGSADNSGAVCERLASTHPGVHVIHNEVPGWGRAVQSGLAAAKADLLAYTNSARTSPFTLITLVMYGLANPGTILKANRRLRYPIVRRVGSGLYNLLCRSLFDLSVWDLNGTPKLFQRAHWEAFDLQEQGDLIDLELLVRCRQLGLPVLEVPIVSGARHSGRSTTGWGSALRLYTGALRLWWRYRHEPPPPPGVWDAG